MIITLLGSLVNFKDEDFGTWDRRGREVILKDLFPGYYKPSKEEFDSMWENGLFIFDTNVLLDIYRYSDETSEALIKIFEKLSDRIWIPYQAALEYHKNLYTVISKEAKSYTAASKNVSDLLEIFTSKRGHPFLNKKSYEEIQRVFSELNKELAQKHDDMTSMLTENPLKEKLASIFSGKVGSEFSPEELTSIYQEGEKRYSEKIPPGFADAKDKKGNDKYGDFIFWKEVLRKIESVEVPIFLITGDVKEDWFLKEMGKTISPRPELIAEVKKIKKNSFYIYSTHTFLEYAKKYIDESIEQDAIDEVKELERVILNNEEENDYEAEVCENIRKYNVALMDQHNKNSFNYINQSRNGELSKVLRDFDQSRAAEIRSLYQNHGMSKWLESDNQSKITEISKMIEELDQSRVAEIRAMYQNHGMSKWLESDNQSKITELSKIVEHLSQSRIDTISKSIPSLFGDDYIRIEDKQELADENSEAVMSSNKVKYIEKKKI